MALLTQSRFQNESQKNKSLILLTAVKGDSLILGKAIPIPQIFMPPKPQ